jgi:DNA repair protein RecN (Recombination protein N)
VLRRLRIENLVLIRQAELELSEGLNVITGETGAGKTILANAVGLLLGARGGEQAIGPAGGEAYVEAEFDVPGDEALAVLAELRPAGEDSLVLACRIFADGRTRAYAWGRSAAREDVAAVAERLLAMSGQFEHRRLGHPSYQLAVLDAHAGSTRAAAEARRAWRELQAARRVRDELTASAEAGQERLRELRALAEDTEGLDLDVEEELRAERERHRHAAELAAATAEALGAIAGDEDGGAADLVARAERAVGSVERLAPELQAAAESLRSLEPGLRELAFDLRSFLDSLAVEPGRLEQVEAELGRLAALRRRYRVQTLAELVARAEEARSELADLGDGDGRVRAATEALAAAQARVDSLHGELSRERAHAAPQLAAAIAAELAGMELGPGEFQVEVRPSAAGPGPSGAEEVAFLVRPNAGLPFAPVAQTASGGELSRIALAIAVVAGGETMFFDEVDAGIGGQTAHAVGDALRRLALRAQVITITHLPQIASLADRHFRVEKVDPTHTQISALEPEERRGELERMLGGAEFLALLASGENG